MYIKIIWIAFTLIFVFLAYKTWKESRTNIPPFKSPERLSKLPPGISGSVKIIGVDIDDPLKQFAGELNIYVKNVNQANRRSNLIASAGYAAAAFTALVSMLLT
jgi:hypothetical protein